jgi:hypothetical protein
MKRIMITMLIFFIFLQRIYTQEIGKQPKFRYDFLWETFLPGYNFYRKDEMAWGHFFLLMRLSSLYGVLYYHQRYTSYGSLYKASQWADWYYGLGYSYRDPIDGGYKNTKQFYVQAGREASARNLSLSIHLLFLAIGLYKGYVDNWDDYLENSPIVYQDLRISGTNYDLDTRISFSIRQDF